MSVGLKLEPASESRGLVMTQNPGPHSSVADPVGLGWGPGMCTSNSFPGTQLLLAAL